MYPFENNTYVLIYPTTYLTAYFQRIVLSPHDDVLLFFYRCVLWCSFPAISFFPAITVLRGSGADSGYHLVAILFKHAPMGSNSSHDGIGIVSHVGPDPGYNLDRYKWLLVCRTDSQLLPIMRGANIDAWSTIVLSIYNKYLRTREIRGHGFEFWKGQTFCPKFEFWKGQIFWFWIRIPNGTIFGSWVRIPDGKKVGMGFKS